MTNSGVKENVVLQDCLNYLEFCGIFAFRNNTGAVKIGKRFIRVGFAGSSDILGILPDGRFLAVECKREKGGVISDLQKQFLKQIQDNHGVACVVHSAKELQDVISRETKITKNITF